VSRTGKQSAEAALRAQGVTAEHLLGLAHTVATDELRRRGAYLGSRFEDLVGFLVVAACRAAVSYDPNRSGEGYSFASYVYDVLKLRVVDFYRSKGEGFADCRYTPDGPPIQLVGDRVDALAAAGEEANGSPDLEDVDLDDAAAGLGEGLSAEAQVTLEVIATARARGVGPVELQRATGISVRNQRQRLDALREELRGVSVG
jgi:DNA-directed RNA polymerase specialized sigma24 family protein